MEVGLHPSNPSQQESNLNSFGFTTPLSKTSAKAPLKGSKGNFMRHSFTLFTHSFTFIIFAPVTLLC